MQAVIVTGISSGLGKAFFEYFCKQDILLFCISRRFLPEKVSESQINNRIKLITIDLANPDSLLTDLKVLENLNHSNELQKIIFINNAGTIDPINRIGNLNPQKILDAINVNLAAPMLITNILMRIIELYKLKFVILNITSTMQETIRATSERYFPPRDYFISLKNENKLLNPNDVVEKIIKEYLNL